MREAGRDMSPSRDSTARRVSSLAEAIEVMNEGGQAVFEMPKGKGQVIVGATGQEFLPPNIDEEEEDPKQVAAAPDDDTWLR